MDPSSKQSVFISPRLSSIDIFPSLVAGDLNLLLQGEGDVEQIAFKGWVEQIYGIWENRYRRKLSKVFEVPNVIPVETDAMGDFRHIRNDLVHNGIATEDEAGKCKILKWFKPSEPIVLGMRHVFDLLNQMCLMNWPPILLQDGQDCKSWFWSMGVLNWQTLRHKKPVPKIVSVRSAIDNDTKDGSYRYMLSVVFENGVFGNGPVLFTAKGFPQKKKNALFTKVEINRTGDLCFPDGASIPAETLYFPCVDCLSGEQRNNDKSILGPWIRFRKNPGT